MQCLLSFTVAFMKDKGPWIVKPIASSRGRGIFLVNHVRITGIVEPHLTVTSLVRKPPHYSHRGSVPNRIPQCK